ncbi:hypothetical protein L208DRAFT_370319 [Tricholoma matsutake]|nr:hypothetical protein L208DRAFT_370319 [Tricholoma matsutake 945]
MSSPINRLPPRFSAMLLGTYKNRNSIFLSRLKSLKNNAMSHSKSPQLESQQPRKHITMTNFMRKHFSLLGSVSSKTQEDLFDTTQDQINKSWDVANIAQPHSATSHSSTVTAERRISPEDPAIVKNGTDRTSNLHSKIRTPRLINLGEEVVQPLTKGNMKTVWSVGRHGEKFLPENNAKTPVTMGQLCAYHRSSGTLT